MKFLTYGISNWEECSPSCLTLTCGRDRAKTKQLNGQLFDDDPLSRGKDHTNHKKVATE